MGQDRRGTPAMARDMVETMHRPDGSLALRPIHTRGVGAKGYFEASPVARSFSASEPFAGERVPVTVRFSNGSGAVERRDGWSDIRGMATRFHLAGPSDWDLIAMTLPEFFTPDAPTTLDFLKASQPTPYKGETPWQKLRDYLSLKVPKRDPYPGETISPDDGAKRYADDHVHAQLGVFQAGTIGAPVSYACAAYHAVHTFIVTDPDGVRRWVRFTWQPVAGVLNTDPAQPIRDDYLPGELRKRLSGRETARMSLMMAIGEAGDDVNDSTTPWPLHRTRVVMGELTLTDVPDEHAQTHEIETMSYNPWLLPEGIEASDDPVLAIRKEAYEISSGIRKADPCPFAKGR